MSGKERDADHAENRRDADHAENDGTRITRIKPAGRRMNGFRIATGRAAGAGEMGDRRDQHGPVAGGAALIPAVAHLASLATPGCRS